MPSISDDGGDVMGGGEKGWKVRTALEGGETQGTLPAVRSERRAMLKGDNEIRVDF